MMKKICMTTLLVAGLAPLALGQMSDIDKAFVTKAAQANNYELKAAQIVGEKSHNNAYAAYAKMITADHTKAGQELASLMGAADSSMALSNDVSPKCSVMLEELKNGGDHFDLAYKEQMINSHTQTLQLFQNYAAKSKDNPQIKDFAQRMIPAFKKHLAKAQKLPNK